MSRKIPTAEQLYHTAKGSNVNISKRQFINAVKAFAKLHVNAALKAAADKATIDDDTASWSGQVWDDGPLPQIVVKHSITKAYPLTNVK